jgi:hypothetical protein
VTVHNIAIASGLAASEEWIARCRWALGVELGGDALWTTRKGRVAVVQNAMPLAMPRALVEVPVSLKTCGAYDTLPTVGD